MRNWKNLIAGKILLWIVLCGTFAAFGQKLELVVRTGHSARVNSVAFSPDGKIIASGSSDKTIKLWDWLSELELRTLIGHSDSVNSIAFSPDGKIIASGSSDKTIKLWDISSGKELKTLVGHSDVINTIAFSPNGKEIASAGGLDKTVKLWDITTGQGVKSLIAPTSVNSIAFSPDGKILASGGDGFIKLWDAPSGVQLKTLEEGIAFINSVTFSPDGKVLASGSSDKTVKLWEIQTGQALKAFTGHTSSVISVKFSPDGRTLVSGTIDGTIKLWDISKGIEVKTLVQNAFPLSLTFSPDGRILAYTGINEFNLARAETGQTIMTSASTPFQIKSVVLSPDKKILGISDNQGSFAFLNLELGGHRIKMNEIPDWAKVQKSVQTLDKLDIQAKNSFVELTDKKTNQQVAKLFLIGKDDWVVITPESRFNASPGAQKLMHYVYGFEVIELDQLEEMYYEPGLLRKLLGYSNEPLRPIIPLENVKLYPEILEQQFEEKTGKLVLKLKNRGGGIGETRVLVNDKLAVADARDERLKANPNIPEGEIVTLTVDLKGASFLKGKENKITVITSNYLKEIGKGNIQSRGVETFYQDKSEKEYTIPSLYAVVGGVSDYDGDEIDLRFAAKDAEDFSNALSLGARRLFCEEGKPDCSKVQITTLSTSGNEGTISPTKENFRKAFAEIAAKAKPEDIVVIYLAGHGVSFGIDTDTYFYLTKEARSANKKDLETIFQTVAISSTELTEWLTQTEWVKGEKGIKALKQVLILDTAAAGIAEKDLAALKKGRDLSSDQIRAIEFLKDKTGTFILMGSTADVPSYESSQYGQGLLTYSLLEGMKGAALDYGRVDVRKLFAYAESRVAQLAKNINGIQKPIISAPLGNDFVIGLMTDDERQKINIPQPKPIILSPVFGMLPYNTDPFDLNAQLRKVLDAESSYEIVRRQGDKAPDFIFLNADHFPEAIRPMGTYSIDGKLIEVRLFLIKDDNIVGKETVIGSIDDKEGLTKLIIEKIKRLIKGLDNSHNETSTKVSINNSLKPVDNSRKVSQIFQNDNLSPFTNRTQFLSNRNFKFNPVAFTSNSQRQEDKIIIIRPRFLSDKKPSSAIVFENGIIDYLKLTYGEGKNVEILYKDVDELQNAVRLEWVYEEDDVFSTVKVYLTKNGQKISIEKDIGTRKGDISFLVISISKWISDSHNLMKTRSRGVETFQSSKNLRQHIGKQYALLIATDDYDYLTDLKNPILDVCTIAKILEERYGFETEIAVNKTKSEINQLIRQYLIKSYEENSELLIFIAGHGSYDRQTNMGYLAAKDSALKDDFFETYISFPELVGKINKIPVKHVWLVLDTCNAGLITKETSRSTEGKLSKEEFVKDRLRGKTRMALAATEGENYVSDGIAGKHSPFARDFINVLLTDGGPDANGILITSEFASVLFENRQKPRFGRLSEDDEPGSDFVFVLLDEEERRKRKSFSEEKGNPFSSDLKECKCIFQKYEKEKYNPKETCEKAN